MKNWTVAIRFDNTGDRQLINSTFFSHLHAGDLRLEDKLVVENAMVEGDEATTLEFNFFGDEVERVARLNLTPEDGIVTAGEADELVDAGLGSIQQAAVLSGSFNHEDTGKQGATGQVTRNPELIITHMLDCDAKRLDVIHPDNMVELTHIPFLRYVFPDLIRADVDLRQVDLAEIKEEFTRQCGCFRWRFDSEAKKTPHLRGATGY